MSRQTANDLTTKSTAALRKGSAFPTIWATVIKGHTLVEGIPRRRLDGERSLVDIPLITGERLVFDGNAKEIRLDENADLETWS